MRKRKWAALICAVILLLAGLSCLIYVQDAYPAQPAALEALAETKTVDVMQANHMTFFLPAEPTAGLIFYPGAKVEPNAYAPLLRACAQRGLLCVLIEMPGNLAVLNTDAAKDVPALFPFISHWFLAGHSLGGNIAAGYAAKHPADFAGLILLAAYTTTDLTDSGLRVLSVYGSEDGVLNRDRYEKNRALLPADFEETIIQGGCHAYFGDYGPQAGDGTPAVTCAAQIRKTAALIADFAA